MTSEHLVRGLVQSLLFSGVGMAVFVAGFFVIRLILPYDVHKEIETDQNTALAVVIGAFILGLAIIIAAAIHG